MKKKEFYQCDILLAMGMLIAGRLILLVHLHFIVYGIQKLVLV